MTKPQRCLALWAILGAATPALLAQPDRITARIDSSQSVVLNGRVPRFATAHNDAGAVDPSFPVSGITLTLKATAAQQADLDQLLLAQQDPKSPSFHQWLTPEQYADRFGASASDLSKITTWLESQGFTVGYVARGRNYVLFGGTAQQVANAFHTQIHSYNVNGAAHYANANVPSVPAALAGLVSGIRGLDDLKAKPRVRKAQPWITLDRQNAVAPADFAAIYDLNPLYSAGIKGDGQKIAIVGQTEILATDVATFRSATGLPAANLTMLRVPGSVNPGLSPGDETESDLDVEWSGASAPNATVVFVYSTDVIDISLPYVIDNNLAPVVSISYGLCEEIDGPSYVDQARTQVLQANAEGMTMLAAAGDFAAADCDEWDNVTPSVAEGGLAVDAPGSIPEVTSMGGTEFDEGSNTSSYWVNGAAQGYIPEMVWNDTAEVGQLDGGGGGVSMYFTQPSWQNGMAPNDGMRHVPDLSFPASNVHDSLYIYSSDPTFGPPKAGVVGGTSCAAPSMAGVVALVNQYLLSTSAIKQAGLGNINPSLYKLAQTQSTAFHDIVKGNNIVPCADSPDCVNGNLGWAAGPGYDSASGLGSVDANNLVHAWSTALATQSVVVPSIDQNPVYEASSNLWTFTLTLTEEAGIATQITGLTINGTSYTATQIAGLFGTTTIAANSSISATYSLQGLYVSSGPVSVPFTFTFANGGNTTMTVPFTGFQPVLAVNAMTNAASFQQGTFAPGMLVTVWGSGMATFDQAVSITPLPQYMAGLETWFTDASGNVLYPPLLYASATQVNMQIPYEIAAGSATLTVGNQFANANPFSLTIVAAAPGIFSYADTSTTRSPIGSGSAHAGDTVVIYITGAGQVSPQVADGVTPSPNTPVADLPTPQQLVAITVGGVPVTNIPFKGIPSWSVGVLQIDFAIPSTVAPGQQPVVVTIGNVPSQPANITIVQ